MHDVGKVARPDFWRIQGIFQVPVIEKKNSHEIKWKGKRKIIACVTSVTRTMLFFTVQGRKIKILSDMVFKYAFQPIESASAFFEQSYDNLTTLYIYLACVLS